MKLLINCEVNLANLFLYLSFYGRDCVSFIINKVNDNVISCGIFTILCKRDNTSIVFIVSGGYKKI